MSPESTRSVSTIGKTVSPVRRRLQVQGMTDVVARVVSYGLSPLVLFAISFFVPFLIDFSTNSLYYAVIHVGSMGLMFGIYLGILRWRGRKLDFELKDRRDRATPLGLTIAALAVLGTLIGMRTHSGILIYTNMAGILMFLAFWIITCYWKVSLHSLTISFLLAGLFLIVRIDGHFWPLILLIPMVVWARIHLRYHDLNQSLVGIILGVSAILLLRWLLFANPLGFSVPDLPVGSLLSSLATGVRRN